MRVSWSLVGAVALAAALDANAAPPDPQAPTPAPVESYSYQTDGRRDPFLSLLGTGNEAQSAGRRSGDGLDTFAVAEISVRGVMQSRDSLVAMIQGPDNKTYVVHQGDKLADGVVKSVTPQGLVIVQDVNDPLSIQKQREVRKLLRSLEDSK
jgi:Tfp pilus assembly protein PilP